MLILGRREGDSIIIDGGIRIVVVSCDRGGVRIGIDAPSHVKILRGEIADPLALQWIGSHRLHVVGDHHGTAHVPVFGMVLEQRQGSAHTVAGHQGLEIGVVTSRQLSQLLQQSVQTVGIHAQSGEHPLVGNTRRIDERGDGRDRRHPIAERMCQAAKQIVMYREPARRPDVAAHV